MQIRLKNPLLEQFIKHQVQAGHFPTPEAVVEDALQRRMAEPVSLTPEDWTEIERSEAQIDRGECVEFDDFSAQMRRKYGIS